MLEVDVGWVNGNYQRILFHSVRTASADRVRRMAAPRRRLALVCFLHQAWRDTLDQAVDMYGKLLDRNRKLVEAWRRWLDGNGDVVAVVHGRKGGRGRCGGRNAQRPGRREPAGARLRRPLDQSEAARPLRGRLSPAGAKDDRRDARVLASALRTDPHCLRRLDPTDPAIVELREWSRLGEELTRDRVRLGASDAAAALALLPAVPQGRR